MPREFSPGFRLSALDVVVLILGALGVVVLASSGPALAFIVGFVVGHFFLFCNVFRLSRPPELIWAVCFTVLAGSTLTTGSPSWFATTILSLVVTIVLIMLEMRKPSYHGVLWQRLNPCLRDWWDNRQTARSGEVG